MSTELVHVDSRDRDAPSLYRLSTDAATATAAIVKATASDIQGKKFVSVEGWQAIAIAHGCVTSATDVERVEGGVRAIGLVRRASDGMLLAQAEGFVGEDEPVWFGGKDARGRLFNPRPMFAIRAMAQTRAISRACRSAFAHVVVMIDSSLGTTPAEEMEAAVHAQHAAVAQNRIEAPTPTPQEPRTDRADEPRDDARVKANKRLYAVMRDAGLTTPDKRENSQRSCKLAAVYLQRNVDSISHLEVNEIHDLATAISESKWIAYEALGLDPLAGD